MSPFFHLYSYGSELPRIHCTSFGSFLELVELPWNLLFTMARSSYLAPKVLLGLVVSIAASSALALPNSVNSKLLSRAEQVKDEYDYIIVGGGTAGLTVADRLTEDGKRELNHLVTNSRSGNVRLTTLCCL